MKKFIKIFAVILAGLFLMICASLFYFMSAGFQTSTVNSFLAQNLKNSKIGNVSIGFGSLKLDDIDLLLPSGDKITAKSAFASYSLSGLFSKKIQIKDIYLVDAVMTVAKPKQQEEIKAAAKVDVKGEQKDTKKVAKVEDKSAEASKEKDFGWEISLEKAVAGITVIAPDSSKAVSNIEISKVEVSKKLLPKSCALNIKILAQPKGFASEEFTIASTLTPDGSKMALKALIDHKGTKLLQASASLSPDYKDGDFEAKLDLKDSQVAPLTVGIVKLPEFNFALYVSGNFKNMAEQLAAKIICKTDAKNLKNVNEMLGFLGLCNLDLQVDVTKKNSIISVSKLDVVLSESNSTILSAEAAQEFAIDTNDLSKLPDGDLAVVKLALPARYLSALAKDFTIQANDFTAKFSVARGADNSIALKTISPLTISAFSLSKQKEVLLKDFNAFIGLDASSNLKEKAKADVEIKIADSKDEVMILNLLAQMDNKVYSVDASVKGALNPIIKRVNSISSFTSQNLKIDSKVIASLNGDLATIKKLDVAVLDSTSNKVVDIADSGEILYNLKDKKISAASKTLLKISAANFPFALIKPFANGVDIASIAIEAKVGMPNENVFDLSSNLDVKGVSFKTDGNFLVKNISPSAEFYAVFDLSKMSLKADLKKLELAEFNTNFLTANANLDFDVAKKLLNNLALKANLHLAPLATQPALVKFINCSTGSLELDATLNSKELNAIIALNNLSTRTVSGKLDTLKANAKIGYSPDFKKIDAKLILDANSTNGSTSAVITVNNDESTKAVFDAKNIVVEDLMLLAAAFNNPNADAAQAVADEDPQADKKAVVRPTAAKKSSLDVLKKEKKISLEKDKKAFWNVGRNIYLDAKIGNIQQENRSLVSKLEIAAICEAAKVAVSKLSADIMGASLSGGMKITFDQNAQVPYQLSGTKVELKNFESAQIFANKQHKMISGKFDADVMLESKGNNMAHLFAYATGNANIKGSGGVLQLIDKNTDSGAITSIAGSAMQIAGMFLGNKAKEVGGAGEIISYLGSLDYTKADINISRTSKNYNISIDKMEIFTKALVISATGGYIEFDPNIDFKEQKLEIPVRILIADGGVRMMFQKINYGDIAANQKGYFNGPAFEITGTVGNPSNNLLQTILTAKSATSTSKNDTTNADTKKSNAKGDVQNASSAVQGLFKSLMKK